MDRLQLCMEELRRLANETEDLDCVILAEQAINDYLKNEINALRAALERIGKAIDDEARMGQGGDSSLMVGCHLGHFRHGILGGRRHARKQWWRRSAR